MATSKDNISASRPEGSLGLHGHTIIHFVSGDTMLCPKCLLAMKRIYIINDGIPILSGYGTCKCSVPKKYLI